MRRLACLVMMLLAVLTIGTARAADPVPPKASAGPCVEEPATMRRFHPEFLKHQRDDTLRQGIRGAKHSLKECVACHATTDKDGHALPVNGEGQFCQSCHAYAAVSIDCFSCHATTPDKR